MAGKEKKGKTREEKRYQACLWALCEYRLVVIAGNRRSRLAGQEETQRQQTVPLYGTGTRGLARRREGRRPRRLFVNVHSGANLNLPGHSDEHAQERAASIHCIGTAPV